MSTSMDPHHSTLMYVTEYALSTLDGGMWTVPFITWLALRLVNRALYRRFKDRAVRAFLAYARRRIAAFAAPLEVPDDALIGGRWVLLLINGVADGDAVHQNYLAPHMSIVVHGDAVLTQVTSAGVRQGLPSISAAPYRANGGMLDVFREKTATKVAAHSRWFIWSYQSGRFTKSLRLDRSVEVLFCPGAV